MATRPPSAAGLETYAAEIQEVVLYLRDEGHVLSPIDQHLVELWWESGFPLDVVLRTVWKLGHRLKARKNPPRGLPLRSMKRQVEKAGLAALRARLGRADDGQGTRSADPGDGSAAPASEDDEARQIVSGLLEDIRGQLAARVLPPEQVATLEAGRAQLQALVDGHLPAHQLLSALLQVGRSYYETQWLRLSAGQRQILRADVLDGLGGSVARMSPDAVEETVLELCRRRLRAQDPLFDPQRYWRLP